LLLYTAECGLTYHKAVFALPGNIYDPLSEGSNTLISKGAAIYLRNPLSTSSTSRINVAPSIPLTQEICDLLSKSPLTIDILNQKLNLEPRKLQEILLLLELDDHIEQQGGLVRLKK